MIEPDEEVCAASEDDLALADLTEEISRRLESGDPVNGGELGESVAHAGGVRQLLPALRTMVSLGEQVAREEGTRTRSRKKSQGTSSSFLDTNPNAEEVGL